MTRLIILGSANSIPVEQHENTHMAVVGQEKGLLIDCVSNPMLRIPAAGIQFDSLTDLVLTHFHPDHVSGVPLLLMDMWLLGRSRPLNIYGLPYTIDRIEKLMEFYDWVSWPNFYKVTFHRLADKEMTLVLENDEFRVFSSPVKHLIPNIGLRVEFVTTGRSLAYSCDTEPCSQVIRLAAQVDVLIHEATGDSPGHSSAAEAGEIAQQADARALYLIHYHARGGNLDALVEEAAQIFPGEVHLARDFMQLEF